MEKVFFNSTDGIKLVGIWHYPLKKTRKVVILIHGITIDKDEDGIFIPRFKKTPPAGGDELNQGRHPR